MAGTVVPNVAETQTQSPPNVTGVGGAVKPSQILGSIAGVSTGLGAVAPILAPITIPLSILTGLGSSIASLFGGRLTQAEFDMLANIKKRVETRRQMGRE